VAHPSDEGVMFARTDVGGAYAWDAAKNSWRQMLLKNAVEAPVASDYSVESIALSPSNSKVVYLAVGDDDSSAASDVKKGGSVLSSTNGGQTWKRSETHFTVAGNDDFRQRSERLAVSPADPKIVLFGTRREGLWRSTDGASTFARVDLKAIPAGKRNEGSDAAGITFVSFDPDSPDSVYAGVAGEGVFASKDSGVSWKRIVKINPVEVPSDGTIGKHTMSIAVNSPSAGKPGRIELVNLETGGVKKITPDREATEWTIAMDPQDPQRLIAADGALSDYHSFRSTDGGKSWTSLTISIESSEIPWLANTDIADWLSVGRVIFDPHDRDRIWFAEGMGVWTATNVDQGEKLALSARSNGIEETVVSDIIAPRGVDVLTAIFDRQGFRHDNIARYPTQTLVDGTFAGGTDLDWSGQDPSTIVWIGAEYQRYWSDEREGRAAISRDGGKTFAPLPNLTPDMFGGNVAVSATDPNNIVWLPSYYLSPGEYQDKPRPLYVTTDGGKKWTAVQAPGGHRRLHRLMWWVQRRALAADRFAAKTFYLYDDEEHFMVSTDGGLNWNEAAHAPPCEEASDCHVHGQLEASPTQEGVVWAGAGRNGLFKTSDRGETAWEKVPGVDEVDIYSFGAPMAEGQPAAIYLLGMANGDTQKGVYRSVDNGSTWSLIGRTPFGIYEEMNTLSGDMNHPGRVYIGYSGVGAIVGEDRSHS
jgi:photosystem II stability/assembly factor-like uncharacterized protein